MDQAGVNYKFLTDGITNQCTSTGGVTGNSAQLFLTLINALFLAQCKLHTKYPKNVGPTLRDGDEFDFIVVGSGSAGSVVANRLSENGNWNVLLLEAGTYPSTSTEIPGLSLVGIKTNEDWQYNAEITKGFARSLKNKVLYPRGKVLGGTSGINGMIYLRGCKRDHDEWSEMGCEGWDYESILPYYKKSENVLVPNLMKSNIHGKDGYLTLDRTIYDAPIRKILINAAKEMGYNHHDDQPPASLGYFDSMTTIENGTRCSSSKAFLSKIKRDNFHLATNAHVTKLIIDEATMKTKGVTVQVDGKNKKIYAKKEVILSAGVIGSAQLLMLSGIGPKEHLNNLQIKLIKDLPVGDNFKDHVHVPIALFHVPERLIAKKNDVTQDLFDYFMYRKGPLSTTGLSNFIGMINTKNNTEQQPDMLLLHFLYHNRDNWNFLHESFGYNDEYLDIKIKFPAIEILPIISKPKSIGKVVLSTSNPFDKPIIRLNFFTDKDDADINTLINGLKYISKLTRTKPFKENNLTLFKHDISNCKNHQYESDDYWMCIVKNTAIHTFHGVGTCKMGLETDKTTVVNSRLRVHGVNNLRVIDASVMPSIISGAPNAPSIMIGEKGADLIKDDWK